jgi:hypothetical protein
MRAEALCSTSTACSWADCRPAGVSAWTFGGDGAVFNAAAKALITELVKVCHNGLHFHADQAIRLYTRPPSNAR